MRAAERRPTGFGIGHGGERSPPLDSFMPKNIGSKRPRTDDCGEHGVVRQSTQPAAGFFMPKTSGRASDGLGYVVLGRGGARSRDLATHDDTSSV